MVDRDPGPGDYRVSLGSPGGTIDLQELGVDPQGRINEFDLVDAEIVFRAPACVDRTCMTTLERLRFDLPPFGVSFTDGRNAQFQDTSISFQTPIEMQSSGGDDYVLPGGSILHTCTRVDDHPWHAVTPTFSDAVIRIDPDRHLLTVQAAFEIGIRAVDEKCSEGSLRASVNASFQGDWTLVPDSSGEDAAPPAD